METNHFEPPGQDDYRNVTELNLAWLRATTTYGPSQCARMANVPFLLFSMRETDLDWWQSVLGGPPQDDWLQSQERATESLRPLQSAALSFLWHLAWRNPYAVRLICGASTMWCDLLKQVPLVTLVERVGQRGDLCAVRQDPSQSNAESLHVATLHSLLTTSITDSHHRLPAAACRMPQPVHQVADKRKE